MNTFTIDIFQKEKGMSTIYGLEVSKIKGSSIKLIYYLL